MRLLFLALILVSTASAQDVGPTLFQNVCSQCHGLKGEGKEDDEDLFDLATLRKRAAEDWADGVPKGSGVTKRV